MHHDWRNRLVTGSRHELIKEVRERQVGFAHQGSAEKADEAAQAVYDLLTGDTSVQVGVMTYNVTET